MIIDHQSFKYNDQFLLEKIKIKAPFRFVADFNNEACFIHFFAGEARINAPQSSFLIKSKESVVLKCGKYIADLFQYGKADEYEILVFHLYPDILREIYKDELPPFVKDSNKQTSFFKPIDSSELVSRFVESLQFYFENPAFVNDELLRLKIKELILFLLKTENAATIENLFSDLFTPKKVSLMDVVQDHLFSNLSINSLAELCHLSVSSFNRNFQKIYGDTPANYIKEKRLLRARDLLAHSHLTITEVAMESAFNDLAHFSRSFKQTFGMSPKAYRQSKL